MRPYTPSPAVLRAAAWLTAACLFLAAGPGAVLAASPEGDDDIEFEFDDEPRLRDFDHPAWFKESFLDLPEDLEETLADGRRALMVYFGQHHCAYCEALMQVNFKDPDIVAYTRSHFEVVDVNIWGDREVVTMDGEEIIEKDFAVRENTNFTPSIIFYAAGGEEVFRLRGYYPPYKFRAALEYVADAHYRNENFREYLERADPPAVFEEGGLAEEEFFAAPPHMLDRTRFPASRPLVVFFEQGNCHACDILHTAPLNEPSIRESLMRMEVVQLDMWSETPVITPDGRRTTAREWAADLGLFYAPSLIFFDEDGKEIIRMDSVARFFRLNGVLRYVAEGGYRTEPNFQRWRDRYGMAELADD